MNKIRCINLDWLEVYALEPISETHNADYFRSQQFAVLERDYGTRIYSEMFTIVGADDYPFVEVRRNPKNNSILPINATHLRFVNRRCYEYDAGTIMAEFLKRYGYTFVSISRVDICLDFEKFDSGDDPQKFVKRYVGHKYAKINQSQASAHFDDCWERRDFNSFSWGSRNSDINTKLYNKTMELYDEKAGAFRKPYILQAWFESQLVDDPIRCIKKRDDGREYRPQIWRLEFSIKSNVKGWFAYRIGGEGKEIRSVRNTLETYANRPLLLPIFDLLQQHYFHFKKFEHGKSKYQCRDKNLFDFSTDEVFYRVEHLASQKKPDALVLRLTKYLQEYLQLHPNPDLHKAAAIILEKLQREEASRLNFDSYSRLEYEAMQRAIELRLSGSTQDPATLANDLMQLLESEQLF